MQAGTTQIHRRRLIQLTGLAEVPLLFIGFKSLIEKSYLDASVLLISAVAMLSVFWALKRGKQGLASFSFVSILTLTVLFLQWNFGGVIDVSMLALPGILIFASMIGALRIYNVLLFIMVVNVLLMGFISSQGYMFRLPSNGISSALNVAVILLVVGFATRILSRDNFSLLKQLRLQIEEAETARNVVEHQAYHDYLTDLPNRMMAEKTFLEIQQRLKRHPEMTGGVIYIDFDEFKDINDNLGHAVGDQFLIRKTKRLKECTRVTDTLCRIGGDEFLVLVEDANEVQLAQFAGKLLDEVMAVENFDGHSLHCTCSIGIVFLPKDAHTYEQAVQRADIAMYRSKHHGKNQFHFYDNAMETSVQRRYALQNRIAAAIVNKEFSIALQPIIEVSTGAIVGAEALARWDHPLLGNITPTEFIPIAENTGAIAEISDYVLTQTCQVLQLYKDQKPDFYISINISPIQLQVKSFFEHCQLIVEQYGIRYSNLKFEITESQIINHDRVFQNNVDEIHKAGVGLFLDDFGTGFSNLSHLQKMKFETIKIDRSFIIDCYKDKNSVALLSSIKAMAEELQVTIVAEGIETEPELREVQRLGIHKGQGYYWSPPLEVEQFLQRYGVAAVL